jgi:dTDP-4-amino-4,6-dideoxygalactose transaminase
MGIKLPVVPGGITHAFHLFVIECEQREAFASYLDEHGISTARHYPLPVHLQPAYIGRLKGRANLPVTEQFYGKLLTLPLYPELPDSGLDYICNVIKSWKT